MLSLFNEQETSIYAVTNQTAITTSPDKYIIVSHSERLSHNATIKRHDVNNFSLRKRQEGTNIRHIFVFMFSHYVKII